MGSDAQDPLGENLGAQRFLDKQMHCMGAGTDKGDNLRRIEGQPQASSSPKLAQDASATPGELAVNDAAPLGDAADAEPLPEDIVDEAVAKLAAKRDEWHFERDTSGMYCGPFEAELGADSTPGRTMTPSMAWRREGPQEVLEEGGLDDHFLMQCQCLWRSGSPHSCDAWAHRMSFMYMLYKGGGRKLTHFTDRAYHEPTPAFQEYHQSLSARSKALQRADKMARMRPKQKA